MSKRKTILEPIPDENYDEYSFEGPIITTLERLSKTLQAAYAQGYSRVHIKRNYAYDEPDSFTVYGTRYETEEEHVKRLAKASKARETKTRNKIRKAKEQTVERLILYRELQEEFGD